MVWLVSPDSGRERERGRFVWWKRGVVGDWKMWMKEMEGEGEMKGRRNRKRKREGRGGWRKRLFDIVATEGKTDKVETNSKGEKL